ncbi:hypothetical protein [Arthrobacter sp. SLBN-53]|uniref:hypothetical protein n=1 Tax=Arthrobacter sp. SLBN-53 TaxID=2768412 RepID=UPI00114E394D|nr:hypothetical protein [Arthrobacter sp. SLBN-53]TQK29401.1 hypothetical protein FBY28_2404 [Arthrobacter sp. SLBN-53]
MNPEQRRRWVRLVLRYDRSVLTGAQKTVLIALELYADYRDGTNAYPGEENLAADTGLTARAVRDAMKRGRDLGLIVRTALENPKAGRAAVYRLAMPATTGTTVPVDNSTTGTTVPVNEPTTGTTVPVDNSTTGTATRHHRNSHVATTGTAVPPTLPAPSNHQLLVSESGTSPAELLADTHTDRAPSRFCDLHPQGTRQPCGQCANARTAFNAWQADRAAADVAIAAAEDRERQIRRQLINACHAAGGPCDDFGRLDDLTPCTHPGVPRIEHAS